MKYRIIFLSAIVGLSFLARPVLSRQGEKKGVAAKTAAPAFDFRGHLQAL
jgi:hypothetical protein